METHCWGKPLIDHSMDADFGTEVGSLLAHLYVACFVDTFPIVRRKDEARWGEYRTKRLVMEGFEALRH